jgi:hypothetical protein
VNAGQFAGSKESVLEPADDSINGEANEFIRRSLPYRRGSLSLNAFPRQHLGLSNCVFATKGLNFFVFVRIELVGRGRSKVGLVGHERLERPIRVPTLFADRREARVVSPVEQDRRDASSLEEIRWQLGASDNLSAIASVVDADLPS